MNYELGRLVWDGVEAGLVRMMKRERVGGHDGRSCFLLVQQNNATTNPKDGGLVAGFPKEGGAKPGGHEGVA